MKPVLIDLYCCAGGATKVAGVRHGVTYQGNMLAIYGDGGGKGSFAEWEEAMGIDWITVGSMKERKRAMAEAIAPVYTEFIGLALRAHIWKERAA